MNYVIVAGHMGADPETRFTQSGQKVTTIRLACNIRKSGKEETIWWRLTLWGDRFDKMLTYLKKGSALMAVGQMGAPQTYVDKSGETRVSLDLTVEKLDFSPFGKTGGTAPAQEQTPNSFGEQTFSPQPETAAFGAAAATGMAAGTTESMTTDPSVDNIPF